MLERLKKNSERLVKWLEYLTSLEFKQKLTQKHCSVVMQKANVKVAKAKSELFHAARDEIDSAEKRTANNLKLIEKLAERNADNDKKVVSANEIANNAFA